jgi:predicted nucleic acid-binding protein
MAMMVLDASMALAWFFRDEESAVSELAFAMTDDHVVVVPPHWFAEVANGFRTGERANRSTPDEAARFVTQIDGLDLEIDRLAPFAQFELILPLARKYDLTVYDAVYLHAALSASAPLATLDKALAQAARAAGVTVVGDQL